MYRPKKSKKNTWVKQCHRPLSQHHFYGTSRPFPGKWLVEMALFFHHILSLHNWGTRKNPKLILLEGTLVHLLFFITIKNRRKIRYQFIRGTYYKMYYSGLWWTEYLPKSYTAIWCSSGIDRKLEPGHWSVHHGNRIWMSWVCIFYIIMFD